jgi:membrane protease YdiL (CAAX protease family)
VAAGGLFSLAHVPRYLVDGATLVAPGPELVLLAFSGIGFGLGCELTRNLPVVIVLHAFGNGWPLFVEVGAWPNWPLVSALYLLVVVGYRYRVLDTTTTSGGAAA